MELVTNRSYRTGSMVLPLSVLTPDRLFAAATREELSVQNIQRKKDWVITDAAFQRLLGWLDQGTNSSGQSYLDLRQRLVAYFDRKNCHAPDELADETLNRVTRRLEEEENIISDEPARYCYIVARFVFLEHLRARKDDVSLHDLPSQPAGKDPAVEAENASQEKLMICLDQCSSGLPPANRDLIIRYYYGEQQIKIENRRAMAQGLGISVNALSIRACRIREKLEACVKECFVSA